MSVFVTHDGPDENGVRAEVWVEKGVGKIVNLTVPKGVNARLEIKTEGFDHPQYGWTRTDDPLYPKIVEAYESKADIQYRIESQRKREIDRSLPIAPLREDMALAKKNTNKIFAALNGEHTLEAVTDPAEDPAPNGRISAIGKAPAAAPAETPQAPQQNNNGSSAPRRNLEVEEEPPWAEFNSDGTVNFGSYSMQAAVGAELFVRKQLTANGEQPDFNRVLSVAVSLLEIADKLQAYFTGKTRARKKGSHTRVRSVVYDTVENFYPIPATDANHDEWVKNVGRLSMERLKVIVSIFEQGNGRFNNASAANSGNAPANNSNAKAPVASNQTAPAPQKAEEPAKVQEPAPVQEKAPEAHPEVDVEAARPSGPAPTEVPDLLASASPAVNIFAPVDISKITGPKATKENIEVFKELVTESEAPFPKVTQLLNHTFGVTKASEVPDSVFVEFLDHYTADPEEFVTALEYIDTIRN